MGLVALGSLAWCIPTTACADPPAPLPGAALAPTAPPPTAWAAPPPVQPPLPPLAPLAPGASRARPRYGIGILGGVVMGLTGEASRNLNAGGGLLVAGSDEFTRNLSGRFEVGFRRHDVGSTRQSLTMIALNVGGRIYPITEGIFRPYVGAHFGWQMGFLEGGSLGTGPTTLLSIGVSVGANFQLGTFYAVGGEVRGEGVVGISEFSATTGTLFSALATATMYLP